MASQVCYAGRPFSRWPLRWAWTCENRVTVLWSPSIAGSCRCRVPRPGRPAALALSCSPGRPAAPLGRGGGRSSRALLTRRRGGGRQTRPSSCSPAAPWLCRGCPQPPRPAPLLSAMRTSLLPKTFLLPTLPWIPLLLLLSSASHDSNSSRMCTSCAGHSRGRWSGRACDICAVLSSTRGTRCQLSGGTDAGACCSLHPVTSVRGGAGIRTQAFNCVFKYPLLPWGLVSVDFNSPGAGTVLLLYLTSLAQQRQSDSAK